MARDWSQAHSASETEGHALPLIFTATPFLLKKVVLGLLSTCALLLIVLLATRME